MALRDQLRIMVVDDTATSRGLITHALESFGIRNIAAAADGREAVQSIARAPVHLVVSDYNMPEMDGMQLLASLRNSPTTAKVGFLLITGRADRALLEKGKQLGMNNYLNKPFQPADLKTAIEAIVGRL